MLVVYQHKIIPSPNCRIFNGRNSSDAFHKKSRRFVKCSLNLSTSCATLDPTFWKLKAVEESIYKIKKRLTNGKVEISPSAYDTAWVAMVPSRDSSVKPSFPQCLEWILDNQNPDGSWGLDPNHPSLVKDSLSCTLACLLALRKWNVGHYQIQKGLDFISSNEWAISDTDQFSPVGFDIVFPTMLHHAKELNLTLPLNQRSIHSTITKRESESKGRKNQNLEYLAEGLGKLCNWNEIMTMQRRNGSLFNSPASTAAALIHSHNDKCFNYLHSLLKAFDGWVPTVYPLSIYARLAMVDTLERLGVARYFGYEVRSILDETYRYWQQKGEEIFADVTCRAMAFRILRTNGYEVSSEALAEYAEQEHFLRTVSIQYSGANTVYELYLASQVRMHDNEEEKALVKLSSWTSQFLKQQLRDQTIPDKLLHKQIKNDLNNFHGMLDRIGHRRNIEVYVPSHFHVLKTAYRCPTIHNEDFLQFSRIEFNSSQALYQKELQEMERWYTDCRLDKLNFGRNTLHTSYYITAAIILESELADARLSYALCVALVSRLDDFFDEYASKEEALNLIELIKKWEMKPDATYCSREVELLFTALYNTINEFAAKAYKVQGRCVKKQLVALWVKLLTNFAKEKESWREHRVSTLEEYVSFAWKTIACETCILTSLYLVGIKLPEEMFTSEECNELCRHCSLVCRLLNDLKTFKKEAEEGTINSVSVQTSQGVSQEEAISKIQQMIEYSRQKLLHLVVRREGSIVPKACKDIFWRTNKHGYCLYYDGDEYTSPREVIKDMNAMIWEPISA